jgi:4,5-DOPA dioxygenase extradiol
MPAVFAGHGSPMNAIEDNPFHRSLRDIARGIPSPRAILCISAHWETDGVSITASPQPSTIHDFHGFPRALHEAQYPAPGDPALARRIAGMLPDVAHLDEARGLDHGSWGILLPMYPEAQIPVMQLSLHRRQPPSWHYALAQSLAPLRREGVLIIGSGNIVHNLARIDFASPHGAPWADDFNNAVKQRIAANDHHALTQFHSLTPDAHLAVPTPEHFLPLLYALGVRRPDDTIAWFNDQTTLGSISMTSFVLNPQAG